MSFTSSTQHLTEIQTLSLLPDERIDSWSSEVRKSLQAGLRITASHPKCDGIYWLKKTDDPNKIVVIFKWTEAVDLITSRSYLRSLLPYLASPPARSIHVNHELHSFSSYNISNFLTVYFPIRYCSFKFKSQITANVNSFISATDLTDSNPESLRFVASGWTKETKMMDGEVASGFMFCFMWNDWKSGERYKNENEHWRVLMRYLKGIGMIGEEQYHGTTFQILGEGQTEIYEFSDDSSSEDDDMGKQLELRRERLRKLASTSVSELQCVDAKADSDLSGLWNRPGHINDAKYAESSSNFWSDDSVMDVAAGYSEEESPDSTPILTPSSSTMSMNSLFDNHKHLCNLPGAWKYEYDISLAQEGIMDGTTIADPGQDLKDDKSAQPIFPRSRYRYELSSHDEDKEVSVDLDLDELSAKLTALSATNSDSSPIAHRSNTAQTLQGIISRNHTKASTSSPDEKAIPELMRRYGVPRLDPEEELRNAKSRFWRRSMRLSPPPLERQRATLHDRSPTIERGRAAERILTIDPLRSSGPEQKRKGSWWTYVKDCLPNPASGSIARPDFEPATDAELTAAEEGTVDNVTAQYGDISGLREENGRDLPLSIKQMEEAKVRGINFV